MSDSLTICCASATIWSRCAALGSSPRRACRCLRCPTGGRRTIRFLSSTLRPPMGALLPGALVSRAVIGSPGQSGRLDGVRRESFQRVFLFAAWRAHRFVYRRIRRSAR